MSNKKKLEQAYKSIHNLLCNLDAELANAKHMQPLKDYCILDERWARRVRAKLVQATRQISEAMGYERPAMRPLAPILQLHELKKEASDD